MADAALLEQIDSSKLTWFHIRTILVSGVGFYTDAFDLFVINLVTPMIAYVYYDNNMSPLAEGAIKAASTFGTLFGQLIFGYLADKYGRKGIYGLSLAIIIFATVGTACSGTKIAGVAGVLIFWRFILGIGIGGDYPLSAVITSEFGNTNTRGQSIAAVFSMQGFGILTAPIVVLGLLAAFKPAIEQNVDYLDYVWRLSILAGAIPGLATLYFRLTFPESPRYTAAKAAEGSNATNVNGRSSSPRERISSVGSDEEFEPIYRPKPAVAMTFSEHFSKWDNLKLLLGCSIAWFALDVAFYGINLNQSLVLSSIGVGGSTPYEDVFSRALGNLIISLLGTVPGYWVTVFTVEKLGRIPIQRFGFIILALVLVILGLWFNSLVANIPLFLTLYTIGQFFFNFGPNATTFILPSEVFPTRFRSTCHGISAASGKLGAILAGFAFAPLKDVGGKDKGLPVLLVVFAGFMVVGLVVTSWIPETKGKSLEELGGDDVITKVRYDVLSGDETHGGGTDAEQG
ncbi:phosphate transporter [Cladochytrium replicatum]|nr:phosphate transporter [Cladochytrium replicatum]